MALTNCKECGKQISDAATACPHCGAPVRTAGRIATSAASKVWTGVKILVALFVGLAAFRCASLMNERNQAATSIDEARRISSNTPSTPSRAACNPASFVVGEVRMRREYEFLILSSTVSNKGQIACGVQLKASIFDASGAVLDTRDFWPASIRNIPPGADEAFQYNLRDMKGMKTYELRPIQAKQWRDN
jgi:hypothetical protein